MSWKTRLCRLVFRSGKGSFIHSLKCTELASVMSNRIRIQLNTVLILYDGHLFIFFSIDCILVVLPSHKQVSCSLTGYWRIHFDCDLLYIDPVLPILKTDYLYNTFHKENRFPLPYGCVHTWHIDYEQTLWRSHPISGDYYSLKS